MKKAVVAASKALIRGLLIVVPVYLAILLLLKGMKSVAKLVRPFTPLLPDWVPAEEIPFAGPRSRDLRRHRCHCRYSHRTGGSGLARNIRLRANSWLWGHPQPHAPDGGQKP
jgi:hypothetical protein